MSLCGGPTDRPYTSVQANCRVTGFGIALHESGITFVQHEQLVTVNPIGCLVLQNERLNTDSVRVRRVKTFDVSRCEVSCFIGKFRASYEGLEACLGSPVLHRPGCLLPGLHDGVALLETLRAAKPGLCGNLLSAQPRCADEGKDCFRLSVQKLRPEFQWD